MELGVETISVARGRLNPGFLSFSGDMKIGDGYLQGLLGWLIPGNDGEDGVSFIPEE